MFYSELTVVKIFNTQQFQYSEEFRKRTIPNEHATLPSQMEQTENLCLL